MSKNAAKKTNTKLRNHIFARPILLTWFISALVLNVFVHILIPPESVSSNTIQIIAIRVVTLTLLGFFFGMFTIWPLMRKLCIKLNGGPYKENDRVFVISGKHKGLITTVREMTIGQGGWNLLILNTQNDAIVEEYQVQSV